MMSFISGRNALVIALSVAPAASLIAQDRDSASSSDHPARGPIWIGNYPDVAGIRLNFRDRRLERVRGINATVWQPHEPATGRVTGLALGLPMTGAGRIDGIALGVLGASANGTLRGIALGGLGLGAGGGANVRGVLVAGLGDESVAMPRGS